MRSQIIVSYLLANTVIASARVYYVDDNSNGVQKTDGPRYDNINNLEQSSRDLDLSFSTGDASTSNENNFYPRDNYPLFKRVNPIRPYGTAEGHSSDITNKEMDQPRTYKLIEVPDRRSKFEEILLEPKKNGKSMHTATGDRKGEVILELRVITNNDAI